TEETAGRWGTTATPPRQSAHQQPELNSCPRPAPPLLILRCGDQVTAGRTSAQRASPVCTGQLRRASSRSAERLISTRLAGQRKVHVQLYRAHGSPVAVSGA